MTDYISRADAIEAVKETKPIVRSTERNWGKMIAEQHSKELVKAIKALPSADAVGYETTATINEPISIQSNYVYVVRCKDCVWSKEWNDNQIFCDRILMRLRETDFCSYGERREE